MTAGRKKIEIDVNPGSFRRELARARTFGFMKDVERLWAAGLALGASLENTVVSVKGGAFANVENVRAARRLKTFIKKGIVVA